MLWSSLIQLLIQTKHHCKHASCFGSCKSQLWSVCPRVIVPLDLKSFSWQLKIISLPRAEQIYSEIKNEAAFSHLPRLPVLNVFPVALCSAKHHVFSRHLSSNHVFKSVRASWDWVFPFWHSGHLPRHINTSAGRLLFSWMLATGGFSGWWGILIETIDQ